MNTIDRFLNKTKKVESGCIEWTSTLHRDGYGKFWYKGGQIQAHRIAFKLFVGEIPEGKWILHKCDNRKCVNTDHLYIGDAKQNKKDTIERCAKFGRMKHSFEVIEKCRELYKTGMSQQAIGDLLGVRQTQVSRYVRFAQRVNK